MNQKRVFAASVLIAALGYFVDVYDLILFTVVRIPSLKDMGLSGDELVSTGVFLLNMQMVGMLLGGVIFGILGDKRGRISVLFGSILLYSVANFLNGLVTTVEGYAALRLIAGIGLAGELGAGITLVSEIMSRHGRGYGTTVIATVGVCGAILAGIVAKHYSWRTAYFIGGALGIALLFLRVAVHESGMFRSMAGTKVARGDLRLLLGSGKLLRRYLCCIFAGLPTWFIVGILVALSPEFAQALHIAGVPQPPEAIAYCYVGLVLGDLTSGLLSQRLKSRRKVLLLFYFFTAVSTWLYLTASGASLSHFYFLCSLLGFSGGFWAVFVTMGAEQFGTNLRATVATTCPNFVRGALVLQSKLFLALKAAPGLGIINSAFIVGAISVLIAAIAVLRVRESFGADLDYVEA